MICTYFWINMIHVFSAAVFGNKQYLLSILIYIIFYSKKNPGMIGREVNFSEKNW